jgi:tRNA (guanine-N7-)-methyltransferase
VNSPGPTCDRTPSRPRSWRNRGRLSPADHDRLVAPDPWSWPDPAAAAAWAPQVLDIGFGHGESLVTAAAGHPSSRVLGVEVHAPGVLRARDRLEAAGADCTSVHILRADVTALLPLLTVQSLLLEQAFHPDPWPKRRHAARRLFDGSTLLRLTELLAVGATLHLITDDDSYAAAIRAAAIGIAELTPIEPPGAPLTKYGARARAAGRTIHELAWHR